MWNYGKLLLLEKIFHIVRIKAPPKRHDFFAVEFVQNSRHNSQKNAVDINKKFPQKSAQKLRRFEGAHNPQCYLMFEKAYKFSTIYKRFFYHQTVVIRIFD